MQRPTLFAAALAASLAACGLVHAQTLDVYRAPDAPLGDPGTVTVHDLQPGQTVELVAERRFGQPAAVFRASARFRADGSGRVDVSRLAPVSGSYEGVDRAGLFWSMTATQTPTPADWKTGEVRVSALVDGKRVAETLVSVRAYRPDVVSRDIPGFPAATLASLPGGEPRPVLVVLHGAEGGTGAGRRWSSVLASQGYAVVSLPYYSPDWGMAPKEIPELPGSFLDIRIDQLADLRAWLATQPDVDAARIGLFGGSKGAEFALIAASKYPWIKAVVAYAPSDVVWEGWGLEVVEAEGARSSFSFEGNPLPFMPYKGFVEALVAGPTADLLKVHNDGRAGHPDREAAARIRVEDYRGALMIVAGDADGLWASGQMARNIVASRKAAGLPTTALIYADAGHDLAGDGFYPTAPDTVRGKGSARANAHAQADSWLKMLGFLKAALKP
ncbi:MAG TPA: acyl-CoA thioester hydrolase/BAAT C-terminal domain-containing protein [Caulobacteraceae bacterium]|nr:acyl-CoA thioester hydrolase/BAAT C-terminal domain-containing protein [Caulobacteraceae bacterium]